MGISIYYTACRERPLSEAERAAISAAELRYPVTSLIAVSGVTESEFNGEDFGVYPPGPTTQLGVVFEGATKLPSCTEDAMWAAVQYWCRLLSELRYLLPDAAWEVQFDDHAIPWSEGLQAFDPTAL